MTYYILNPRTDERGRVMDKRLLGYDVIVSPYVPKKQRVHISDRCGCSPEFIREFNAWLRERFGEDEQIFFIGNKMAMTQETLDRIVRAVAK